MPLPNSSSPRPVGHSPMIALFFPFLPPPPPSLVIPPPPNLSHLFSFRSLSPPIRFSMSIFALLILIVSLLSFKCLVGERTRKASKGAVQQIKEFFNEKAAKRFAQNDPAVMADESPRGFWLIRRDPTARRHHDELAVNGADGDYLEGDLELAEWQAERLWHKLGPKAGPKRRRKRKIGRRWDRRRPISYEMAENVPETTRQKIRHALALWQNATCVRFAEDGPDTDRIEFFDGGGCSSFVGRAGGTQGISIATPGCDFVGIIAHEIGHALGTFHEQARPDQSRHIAVHYSNIPAIRWNNFQPISDDQAATLGLPYDAGSVMHYGPYGFAADQFRPTISTLDKHWLFTIGQRESPSFLDIEAVNRAYGCADQCPIELQCLHGGYIDPNECAQCVCPVGFGGPFCNDVQPSPCGGVVKVSREVQAVSVSDFPHNFRSDLRCVWLLRSPPGGHVFVKFDEEPFGYACEDTCDKAFVELKTGPDFRVTGYRFCCSVPPLLTFQSVGEEAVLIHFGGSQIEHSAGFRAGVWSDEEWPQTEAKGTKRGNVVIGGEGDGTALTSIAATTNGDKNGTTESVSSSSIAPMPFSSSFPSSSIVPMPFSSSSIVPMPYSSSSSSSPYSFSSPSPHPTPSSDCSSCKQWSEWNECSQMCGGCGRKTRRRHCPSTASCQKEEKRMCNRMACPRGTNFLFNNGEFHLLWKGCCVGLFLHNGTANGDGSTFEACGPLENSENPFLRIISSLLNSRDLNGTTKSEATED